MRSVAALIAEAREYVGRFKTERCEDGKHLVTKNGVGRLMILI